jgi:TolB-like protein/DNA-binding winged helix-turn-helix (wHTH) protein/Flp pilus assembly protein TadD
MGSSYRSATERLDDVLSQRATPWSEPEEFMKIGVASQLIVIARFVKYSEGGKERRSSLSRVFKFAGFELIPSTFELRRGTRAVKMEKQVMELLLFLVAHRDNLVHREQIADKLWGKDVFVDVDDGINTAIRKIRKALGDNPARPRFVQRVPGRGYRFIAPVTEEFFQGPSNRVLLVVLPFANIGENSAADYFGDGMTEETIANLGSISPEHLGVIARTSSMIYKNTRKTVSQIGKELGVDFVLESSVRQDGNRIRITAQLIRVDDQTHVWAENYDRDIAAIIDVQAELGRAIAGQVVARLPRRLERRAQTANPDAFDLYLRGRFYFAQRTRMGITRAIEFYNQALVLDSDYGLSYAGLADAYATLPITSDYPVNECRQAGIDAATKAVELNGHNAEAHSSLAACSFWLTWDWDTALRAAWQAVELNPSYSLAHFYLAHTFSNLCRHDEAEREMKIAHALDPFSVHFRAIHGQMLYQAGRFEAAAASARRAIALNPNAWLGHIILAKAQIAAGDFRSAMRSLQRAFELSGGNSETLALRAVSIAALGQTEQAREIVAMMQENEAAGYVPACNIAMAFNGLKEFDEAYRYLRLASQQNDVRLRYLPVDPLWREMNIDPRVHDLWPAPQRHLQ